jgi:Na+-transporting NADH:ubiquinone oxidoreductase subunit NqrF
MCKCQVIEGGGEILPTEAPYFSRKAIADKWRLGCQVKVKQDMDIKVPEEVFGIKKWECEVVSNYNVASFIKEFVVKLAARRAPATSRPAAISRSMCLRAKWTSRTWTSPPTPNWWH